jgi:hypothetical protein
MDALQQQLPMMLAMMVNSTSSGWTLILQIAILFVPHVIKWYRERRQAANKWPSIVYTLGNDATNRIANNIVLWLEKDGVASTNNIEQLACRNNVCEYVKERGWVYTPCYEPQGFVTIRFTRPRKVAGAKAGHDTAPYKTDGASTEDTMVTDHITIHTQQKNTINGTVAKEGFEMAIFGRTLGVIREFVDACDAHAREVTARRARSICKWNKSWTHEPVRIRKTRESVFLDQKNEIFDDVEAFLKNEAVYRRKGIPFKRGHLFAGLPGTGKTSLAYALAEHFNMSLYKVGNMEEKELAEAICKVPPRSLVFIDDIDTKFNLGPRNGDSGGSGDSDALMIEATGGGGDSGGKSKDSKGPKGDKYRTAMSAYTNTTLGTLLELLDGYDCLDGCYIIIATNHPEKLDPAVIRPGRMDRQFTIGTCSHRVLTEILLFFYPSCKTLITKRDKQVIAAYNQRFVTATIINSFIMPDFMDNAQSYERALQRLKSYQK